METQPPFQVVSGQRQLAVIMFTDAVGFSAQMHEQEVATLNRIERDSEAMRRIAISHDGTVLKSTGDGLLIQFASAVQAVASALEIQEHFRTRHAAGVTTSTLRHRVAVHLGDVFVGQGDVMGDGVNIAARLVGEALPGGIAISQTVYDVVKNKMPLNVLRLGPQRLKNIKEPIHVYRVLLDEAAAPQPPGGIPANPAPAPAPTGPEAAASGTQFRFRRLAIVLLLVAAIVGAAHFLTQQYLAHEARLEENQSAQAALGALLKQAPAEAGAAPAQEAALDFAALATRTAAARNPTPETLPIIQAAERSVVALLAWLPVELARYTRDRPLTVPALGPGAAATIYLDAGGQLYFAEGGASRRRAWDDIPAATQAAIIVAALRNAAPPANREVQQGADAFAYLHGLPEMPAARRR
jgi:class 3 adenylate cyclase